MWAKLLASVLLVQVVLAQDAEDQTNRRIRPRIRRPRPRLVEIDNPEGELEGSPVPILLTEESAQVIAAAQRTSGNAALDALIATAQKEEIVAEAIVAAAIPDEAAIVDVQDIPTVEQEPITPLRAQRPAGGSRRRVPGVPRRRRPRPERPAAANDDEAAEEPSAPRGRPRGGQEEEAVGTLERYSHNNDDGSFTFGYVGADGSFREETRGVDCITRGKYGYIDPDGVKREYSYTSGLNCEIGEDGEQLQNLDGEDNVVDTVDPRERFRQTQNVQLTDAEIPQERLRQRVRAQTNQRRAQAQNDAQSARNSAASAQAPEQPAAAPIVQQNTNTFSNFGASNSNRGQLPQRRPVVGGAALNNLLNIADQSQPQAAAPAPAPQRIPQRIATAAPAIPQRVPTGSFDFDSELEGFTLNRPSLTFEQNRAAEAAAGGNPSTSFQSSLVFNQQTGTFQTQLQQNIPGSESLNLQNAAAPFAAQQPTAAPATTFAAQNNDFTLTRTQAASPTPTVGTPAPPTARRPTPTAAATGVLPAGTFKLDFEPLNIPVGAIPVPQAARPTTVNLPRPTQQAAVRQPAPTPTRASAPARNPGQGPVPNTFFVFQPFNQGGQPAPSPRPASDPFNTPLNQNAFRIIGGAPGAPRPAAPQQPGAQQTFQPQQFAPQSFQPQQFAPQSFQPQQIGAPVIQRLPQAPAPARPAAPTPARPAAPAPARPATPPAFNPQSSFQSAPQIQFGFQPVAQQPQQQPQQAGQPQAPRRAPFTAFQSGPPPQLQAFGNQQQLFQQQQPQQLGGAPVRFAPAQLGVPPQLQPQQPLAEQPRFAPRPNAARPAQFSPQGGAPTFSVFNPAQQLRGA